MKHRKRVSTTVLNAKRRQRFARFKGRVKAKKPPNPLRADPTRTATLRRKFTTALKRQFNLLMKDIRELLVGEDAFGLLGPETMIKLNAEGTYDARAAGDDPQAVAILELLNGRDDPGDGNADQPSQAAAANAFCPTGNGGGQDNSCSPSKGGGAAGAKEVVARKMADAIKSFGSDNFVHLADLRAKFPKLSKEQFDKAMEIARRAGKVTLSAAEGRFGTTQRDRDAAIHEEPLFEGDRPAMQLYASVRNVLGDAGMVLFNAFCPTGEGGGQDNSCGGDTGSQVGGQDAKEEPKGFFGRIKAKIASTYARMKERYGETGAKVVMGAVVTLLPVPIPGTSMIPVGIAEGVRLLGKLFGKGGAKVQPATNAEEIVDPDLIDDALDLLEQAWQEQGEQDGESKPDRDELRTMLLAKLKRVYGDLTDNVFCATGEGGGVDPTCSPGGVGNGREDVKLRGDKRRMFKNPLPQVSHEMETEIEDALHKFAAPDSVKDFLAYSATEENVPIASLSSPQRVAQHETVDFFNANPERVEWGPLPVVIQYKDKMFLRDGNHRALSQTERGKTHLRARVVYIPEVRPTGNVLANADPLPWRFRSDPDKVRAFQEWLRTQIAARLQGKTEEQLWQAYVDQGFRQGAGRAFDDATAMEREAAKRDRKLDFYDGTRKEFLRSAFGRPESIDKVKLLASRSFDELENVTADMSNRISRHLTDGLVQGKHPRDIADDLEDDIGIGLGRAQTIAQTEIIRAHAEGQLTALEKLGVEEVGVMVEWQTAGDDAVCPRCEALEGVVIKIDEAHNLIPLHPNCRCAFVPANVGEDEEGQVRGAGDIRDRFEQAGVDIDIDDERPRSVLNFDALLNVFCPTGEGGGVDPSCSPSGSSVRAVQSVEEAFGHRGEVRFTTDDSGKAYGEHGSGGAVVVNPHLATGRPVSINFKTAHGVTEADHLAAHELVHQVYSNNSELAAKMMDRLASVKGPYGSAVSMYGAFEGKFENLIELGAVYAHSPQQLKEFSPEMYAIASEWAVSYRRK